MKNTFLKAKDYIMKNGTNLQKICCDYVCKNATVDTVRDALAKYQNNDGGFSNGLEIEYQGDISSPFTTSAALGHMTKFGLKDSTVYLKTMEYLRNTQNGNGSWDDPEELDKFPHPPYMGKGIYIEYKTGMILKWLLLMGAEKDKMIESGLNYMENNFKTFSEKNDFWSAVAYSGLYIQLPDSKLFSSVMEWSMKILMPPTGISKWQQISGMIEDSIKISEKDIPTTLQAIKENQEADGGWPHLFGEYNRVWTAIFILQFLSKQSGDI